MYHLSRQLSEPLLTLGIDLHPLPAPAPGCACCPDSPTAPSLLGPLPRPVPSQLPRILQVPLRVTDCPPESASPALRTPVDCPGPSPPLLHTGASGHVGSSRSACTECPVAGLTGRPQQATLGWDSAPHFPRRRPPCLVTASLSLWLASRVAPGRRRCVQCSHPVSCGPRGSHTDLRLVPSLLSLSGLRVSVPHQQTLAPCPSPSHPTSRVFSFSPPSLVGWVTCSSQRRPGL